MAIVSLYLFALIVSLSLYVAAKSVPDASVFRRVERLHSHTRSLLLDPTCLAIKNSVSNASAVYAPGTSEYAADMGTSLSFPALLRLLIRLTRQNIGLAHQLNMLRAQSNQATCTTLLLWCVFSSSPYI